MNESLSRVVKIASFELWLTKFVNLDSNEQVLHLQRWKVITYELFINSFNSHVLNSWAREGVLSMVMDGQENGE